VGTILKNHPASPVIVFAVWEPILPTDWSSPGASALYRLNDRRVRQFWDSGHLVAIAIKSAEMAGQLHPDCCDQHGFLWDLAAAYAPGSHWTASLPEPVLLNGPIVKRASALESILEKTR
jgi:hypothetical protein